MCDVSALQNKYRFYILNPSDNPGVNYSLWIRSEHGEYPIASSNTGGFVTFRSRDEGVGDGLEPTPSFFHLVRHAVHEAMAFIPPSYFRDEGQFLELADRIYDGQIREYEVYFAQVLSHQFTLGETLIPELEPLAEHAQEYTEFEVPILHE